MHLLNNFNAVKLDDIISDLHPLARRQAPAEGRRPEGEGANIDRRLVPYDVKCKRIQSRIEFIYIYIYLFISSTASSRAALENLDLVNSLQQKLIWLWNKPEMVFTAFFFPKRNIIFCGTKERNLENKTSLYYYG